MTNQADRPGKSALEDSTPMLELYFAFPFKIDKPQFHFEGSHSVIGLSRTRFRVELELLRVQHWRTRATARRA